MIGLCITVKPLVVLSTRCSLSVIPVYSCFSAFSLCSCTSYFPLFRPSFTLARMIDAFWVGRSVDPYSILCQFLLMDMKLFPACSYLLMHMKQTMT